MNCTGVITGREDLITDGKNRYVVANGSEMLTCVVGTGCMVALVIGTFAAVEKDLEKVSAAGLCCFEVASEIAAEKSAEPGSFKEKLFDAVYNLDRK